MRWSELEKSSKGAGGKPRGWKTRATLDKEREQQRQELRRDYEKLKHAGENMIPEDFTGVESDPAADWLDKHFSGWSHDDWLAVNYFGQPPVEAE
jgi:hypothetical protein